MRKSFVAGNWKMNKTNAEATTLVRELLPDLHYLTSVEIVLCPPFTSLYSVAGLLKDTGIGLGVQNLHWEASGAYTGEISPRMAAELCQYAIIGHSERRTYFGETDETVNKKLLAALLAGLTPIVCVGETLAENEAGQTADVVRRQVSLGLAGLKAEQMRDVVIAYEPVWAIGTGRAATPEGANAVHRDVIRSVLSELFDRKTAEDVRILYGGSVTGENAGVLFAQSDIDGGLVGGASLKPDFIKIVKAAG
ncbi:MAG: triose-phosphate isomerase [Anaerolineaceae bacterium]